MTATTRRFTVHGHTVTTRTARRYAVVRVRPEPFVTDEGARYVAFAEVDLRTDDITKARRYVRRTPRHHGMFATIVDLTTGTEI